MAPAVSMGHSSERHVGRVPDLVDRRGDQPWHALSAELRAFRQAVPSKLAELAIRVPESGRRRHLAVCVEARSLSDRRPG